MLFADLGMDDWDVAINVDGVANLFGDHLDGLEVVV